MDCDDPAWELLGEAIPGNLEAQKNAQMLGHVRPQCSSERHLQGDDVFVRPDGNVDPVSWPAGHVPSVVGRNTVTTDGKNYSYVPGAAGNFKVR